MEGYKIVAVETTDGDNIPGSSIHVLYNLALVKLEIPDDAKIVCPGIFITWPTSDLKEIVSSSRFVASIKCRCNKAKIIEVIQYYDVYQTFSKLSHYICKTTCHSLDPSSLVFKSLWAYDFIYKFNEYVEPDSFNDDIYTECSHGIHFCKTIEDIETFLRDSGYRFLD